MLSGNNKGINFEGEGMNLSEMNYKSKMRNI
jgi:hypothetical protein